MLLTYADVCSRGAAAGAADAPVTQASSILRKKGVAAMNKEAVMRRLDELNVRFQGMLTYADVC